MSLDRWRDATLLAVIGVLVICAALIFRQMVVQDEGEFLSICYGPLLVRRIHYVDVTSVDPDRPSIIDGLGIHWFPGRGIFYNLWGRGCAKLLVDGKTVRIGSDDVDNLVSLLRGKIE